ncbi:MAG: universal stress protein [Dehalococcoidia bacterium]|nr:universal stress protein [Dehalococcoidia bacterium]
MYRGVLVTLDGSPLSEAVLPVVADLIAGTKAVVTLLVVGEVPSATIEEPTETVQPFIFLSLSAPAVRFASAAPKYVETKTQALQRRDNELAAYLEQKAEPLRKLGVEVNTIVQFGNPAERIVSYARRPEIDLIVMATHGRTGLRTVIFGSVAGRVLYAGVRPVLLVRPGKLDDETKVTWPTGATHGEAATQ